LYRKGGAIPVDFKNLKAVAWLRTKWWLGWILALVFLVTTGVAVF
jgi:hypothetical protein